MIDDAGNDESTALRRTTKTLGRARGLRAATGTRRGKRWPTSEHYFQAQKFDGTPSEDEIRREISPMRAARMGRDRKRPLRPDWDVVKDGLMREAVLAKFSQHDDIREILLATGDALIVEHTSNDSYWGDGGDGTGKNMLGRILMEVREMCEGAAEGETCRAVT